MKRFETILYEQPAEHVVRVVMNRPESLNAQDITLTYELNDAFDQAAQDDSVKVIILAGAGRHFSAGHDLRGDSGKQSGNQWKPVDTWGGFALPGAEGLVGREEEVYLGMCRRWRNIPKPTIAEVHGKCIAGGLMLMWVCDLVVASDDAEFQDPTVGFGVCGAEWFAHPWELGHRKAKEMLFTSHWLPVEDAYRLGMVNQVVPRADLSAATLDLAVSIAEKPSFALKLAKLAVNQSLDQQGQWTAIQAAYSLHALCHSHNQGLFGTVVDPAGLPAAFRSRFDTHEIGSNG